MYSISEGLDELSEPENIKQQIKTELRKLEEKRKQLTEERLELESKIPALNGILATLHNVSSPTELERIVKIAETTTVVRSDFFKTSKYSVEKDLRSKLEELENRLRLVDGEIRRADEEINDERICPDCQGQGVKQRTEFVREDNMVRTVLRTEACSLCKGRGKID